MGHTINPISQRLTHSFFWNSNWALFNKFNYINLFKKDYILYKYLNWIMKQKTFELQNYILSHYKIYRINNKIYLNLFYYDSYSMFDKTYRLPNEILSNKILHKIYKLKSYLIEKIKYLNGWILFNMIWFNYFNYISIFLKNIDGFKNKFYYNIYKVNYNKFNAKGLGKFIAINLREENQLNWIIKPILKDLNLRIELKKILGYKIICSGRFTRKQRKVKLWYKNGKVQKNYFQNFVQYSLNTIRLKYGVCGVKIWFNYGYNSNIYPTSFKLYNDTNNIRKKFSFFFFKKYNILILSTYFWLFLYNFFFYKEYDFLKNKYYKYLNIYKYLLISIFFRLIKKFIIIKINHTHNKMNFTIKKKNLNLYIKFKNNKLYNLKKYE